jgi:hypothetical protein
MSTKTDRPRLYDANVTYTLYALTCCSCGVLFGLENGFDGRRRKDHRDFYCPNGHVQGYHGPNKAERERDEAKAQLDAARSLAEREANRRRNAEHNAEAERRSAAAYKGHATRIRNRIANGVCPAGCNRHFTNVQRHIATQHPDFKIPVDGA